MQRTPAGTGGDGQHVCERHGAAETLVFHRFIIMAETVATA